jgi:hypothetical protein
MIAKHHEIDILRDVPTLFPYMVYSKVQPAIVILESVKSASAEVVALPRVYQVQIVHKLVDQLLDGMPWSVAMECMAMHMTQFCCLIIMRNDERSHQKT